MNVINFILIEKLIIKPQMSVKQFQSPSHRRHRSQFGSINRNEIKQRLDSLITNDYAVLRRGKKMDADDLLLKNHNVLILEYVRSIYDQYNIQDPMPENQDQSRISYTPSAKKTTKKRKMLIMSSKTAKYSTPKNEKQNKIHPIQQTQLKYKQAQQYKDDEGDATKPLISRFQQQFIPDSSREFDFIEEQTITNRNMAYDFTVRASLSYFEPHQKETEPTHSHHITNHQTLENERSVDLPRSRIHPQNHLEMIIQDQLKVGNQEEEVSVNPVPPIRLPFMSKAEVQKLILPLMPAIESGPQASRYDTGAIDESFRYCVGCQLPLLHANIKFHQESCVAFKQVFRMEAKDIIEYLRTKINKFEDSIRYQSSYLMKEDVDNLQNSSLKLIQQSRQISQSGIMNPKFSRQYSKVMDISQRWCLMTEQINKVNWFLKIRQRLKRQFDL